MEPYHCKHQHQETANHLEHSFLCIATGCTQDIVTQQIHDKTTVLPISTHLKLHTLNLNN